MRGTRLLNILHHRRPTGTFFISTIASCISAIFLVSALPAALAQFIGPPAPARNPAPAWPGYGGNAQHVAPAPAPAQTLQSIHWKTPVDLILANYQGGGALYIHYGSPMITQKNTVVVTVRTSSQNAFELQGYCGYCGKLNWTQTTDYTPPPYGWIPSCGSTLAPDNTLYTPGAGGTVWHISNVDKPTVTATRLAFYGINNYNSDTVTYNNNVFVDTPITCDKQGNIYFGIQVTGPNGLNLQGGLARIAPDGAGSWVAATVAANDPSILKVAQNCAPAISNDGSIVYVGVNGYGDQNGALPGYLLALDSKTLATVGKVRLKDVKSGYNANVIDDGTSSPLIGPDDDVYYGVLEIPWISNDDRGWMLHFDKMLTKEKTPGAFGWDDTGSIVPAAAVPSYTGTSPYLVLTKYNNYADFGTADGLNRVAVLDPNAQMTDPATGATVMNEVISVLGVTPNSGLRGVREWCINSAAIDPITKCALVNSEDGTLYRWDFTTNTLSQKVVLTPGIGEAYTPTEVGPDGTVYAINDAVLFAVGSNSPDVSGAFTVSRGCVVPALGNGISFNPSKRNQMMEGILVTNTMGCALKGPISLVLDNLSPNATLLNGNGVTTNAAPLGSPYITLTTGTLAPGASFYAILLFQDVPAYKPISFTTRVLAGPAAP